MKKPDLNLNKSIREAFGEAICEIAKTNKDIYVVSMDLKSSVCLNNFATNYPKRFIEVGVAETCAAGIAAGLAKTGKTVFMVSFACFSPAMNWAQIKQSICYNDANVKIIGTHAGLLSGELGATHQMLEDIALMNTMPNMEVFAPLDALETKKIISTISRSRHPAYVRLIRPSTPILMDNKSAFTIGKSQIIQKGSKVTVLGYGPSLKEAFSIKGAEIINCSSIKPFDEKTILQSVKKTKNLIVIEDHQKNGGFGQVIASFILSKGIKCKFQHIAVDNQFGQSGKPDELYKFYKLYV